MIPERSTSVILRFRRFIALATFTLLSPIAFALSIEVEGIAPITDEAPGKARVMAVQNAIRQAAMQHSVDVSTTTTMSDHVVVGDSARLRSNARITNVTVADEWQEDGQFHVLVRAEIESDQAASGGSNGTGARKRVAFLQVTLRDRGAAADLPSIEIEIPRMLRKQMESKFGAIGIDASQHVLGRPDQSALERSDVPDTALVARVAQELGAQFLVTGDIIDTGITDDLVGQSRRFEMEFQVYDGISGSLLARLRYDERIVGGERSPPGLSVASSEFLKSAYGTAVKHVTQRAASGISAELDRLPFTARVVRANGKKIYIDAGSVARVRVGDMLLAYTVEEAATRDPRSGRTLGNAEQPVATLVLRSVQPQFSIGELETEQVSLKPGDMVRFAW